MYQVSCILLREQLKLIDGFRVVTIRESFTDRTCAFLWRKQNGRQKGGCNSHLLFLLCFTFEIKNEDIYES